MTRRSRIAFILLAVGLAFALARPFGPSAPAPPPCANETLADLARTPEAWQSLRGRVAHVSDGDTFRLADGTVIRLIGVDAPEIDHGRRRGDPGGREAEDWARGALLGRAVTCHVHPGNARDRFGRTPALVFLDGGGGGCFNLDLLRAGHARVRYLHFSPDARADAFRAAERRHP